MTFREHLLSHVTLHLISVIRMTPRVMCEILGLKTQHGLQPLQLTLCKQFNQLVLHMSLGRITCATNMNVFKWYLTNFCNHLIPKRVSQRFSLQSSCHFKWVMYYKSSFISFRMVWGDTFGSYLNLGTPFLSTRNFWKFHRTRDPRDPETLLFRYWNTRNKMSKCKCKKWLKRNRNGFVVIFDRWMCQMIMTTWIAPRNPATQEPSK